VLLLSQREVEEDVAASVLVLLEALAKRKVEALTLLLTI
jgi:hypothetical protein